MTSREAYRLLADTYDSVPNALIALEERVVASLLPNAQTAIDIAGGTGRWAKRLGIPCIVVDDCEAMLAHAPSPRVCADGSALPFRDASFDLAICAFAIGYCPATFHEAARVTRSGGHIIVTDIHPKRIADGWRRTFRIGDNVIEPASTTYSIEALIDPRLTLVRMIEAPLEKPERAMLEASGKPIPLGPAIFAACWKRL